MTYEQFGEIVRALCEAEPEHAGQFLGELVEAAGAIVTKQPEVRARIETMLTSALAPALAERDRAVAIHAVMTSMAKRRGEG